MLNYSFNGEKNFISIPKFEQLKEMLLEEIEYNLKDNEELALFDHNNNLLETKEQYNAFQKENNNCITVKVMDKDEIMKFKKKPEKKQKDIPIPEKIEKKEQIPEKVKKPENNIEKKQSQNIDNKKENKNKKEKIKDDNIEENNSNSINTDLLIDEISTIMDSKLKPFYDKLEEEKLKREEQFQKIENQLNQSNENVNKSLNNVQSKLTSAINNYNMKMQESNLNENSDNINNLINELKDSNVINTLKNSIHNLKDNMNNCILAQIKDFKKNIPQNFKETEKTIDECYKNLVGQFNNYLEVMNSIENKKSNDKIEYEENSNDVYKDEEEDNNNNNNNYDYNNNNYDDNNNSHDNNNNDYDYNNNDQGVHKNNDYYEEENDNDNYDIKELQEMFKDRDESELRDALRRSNGNFDQAANLLLNN